MAVEDFFLRSHFRISKGGVDSPGRMPTSRHGDAGGGEEPDLREYCKHFLRVFEGRLSDRTRPFALTVFHEATERICR